MKDRYSHDGHDFHFLWTARRALRLLDPCSELVAVTVESASPFESEQTIEEGQYVIDTAEYYGSEKIEDAERVAYCQCKYSTTAPNKPWSAAEMTPLDEKTKKPAGTLRGFSKQFLQLNKQFIAKINSKICFLFITNRPIANEVLEALDCARNKRPKTSLNTTAQAAFDRLKQATKLTNRDFNTFAQLFELQGNEASRAEQTGMLADEGNRLLPSLDTDVAIKLKAMVYAKATSDAASNPVIRKETVLHALGISEPRQLLPAQPEFSEIVYPIPRLQEPAIAQAIISADKPIIIHAPGGVGKSVLATRLPKLMPEGSVSVVFDGFAGGAYRFPRFPRHRHDQGLIQIANELAFQGLCDPLLPVPDVPHNYLTAFYRRLEQVVETLHQPNALLLIVLDAADNLEMAAHERHDSAFPKDLLLEPLPSHCRIVALGRTERLSLIEPSSGCIKIPLSPFTKEETAQHLRKIFPEADDTAVNEFHRLTSANPRVQANELALNPTSLRALFLQLGSTVQTVEDSIACQLETALQGAENLSGNKNKTTNLCIALANLPPRIPCRILAQAADVNEDTVNSFVADFGRPLWLLDEAVQFRDEPVETWFRQNFSSKQSYSAQLTNCLADLADTDPYVASAMPKLLYESGRYNDLIQLALHGSIPQTDDPVERREIVLRRVQFALKTSLKQNKSEDSAKLLLRAAEETSSNQRQTDFLINNADLVALLSSPEHVQNLVFRQNTGRWPGSVLAHCAAMLTAEPRFHGEARSFLRQADDWLHEWISMSDEDRQENPFEIKDIAARALAFFQLFGAEKAAWEIRRWKPRTVSYQAGRILANRLLDQRKVDAVVQLGDAAGNNVFLVLAVIHALTDLAYTPPEHICLRTAALILRKPQLIDLEENWSADSLLILAVIALAETLAKSEATREVALRLLNEFLPPIPDYAPSGANLPDQADKRELLLRGYTLHSNLNGKTLTFENILPKGAKVGQAYQEFKESFETVLPWYQLRVEVLLGNCNDTHSKIAKLAQGMQDNAWRFKQNWRYSSLPFNAAKQWLNILMQTDATTEKLNEWLQYERFVVTLDERIELTRRVAHAKTPHDVLKFADPVGNALDDTHFSASETARYYALLARAVLPVSKAEARAYFELGLHAIDRIDDQARHRLEPLAGLAERAAESTNNPQAAYRLARATELIGYEYDSHKFNWAFFIRSITALSPTSGIAILSRWRDRQIIWLDEQLQTLLECLLEKQLISGCTAASICWLGKDIGEWKTHNFASLLLKNEQTQIKKQTVLDLLTDKLALQENNFEAAKTLLKLGHEHGLDISRLDSAVASLFNFQEDKHSNSFPVTTSPREKTEIDWDTVIFDSTFIHPDEINRAIALMKTQETPWEWEEMYQRMRDCVPLDGWVQHLEALIDSEAYIHIEQFQETVDIWRISKAVCSNLPKLIKRFLVAKVSWFSLESSLHKATKLSGCPKLELIQPLLASAADRVGDASPESLYVLAGILGEQLSPEQAQTVLDFGLDRLEPMFRPEDGDGIWQDKLAPPDSIPEAMAGLLRACLAAPQAKLRWRAAHTVRQLVRTEQQDIINALITHIDDWECPVFTDTNLPFYALHARLYLLIALARGVLDNPTPLRIHANTFARHALRELPHVLIQKCAADTALHLESIFPGLYLKETVNSLKNILQSPYSERKKLTRQEELRSDSYDMHESESEFRFGYDMMRYWFGTLGRVFGVQSIDISKRAENWILKHWKYPAWWQWNADPRAQREHFRDGETSFHHFSYPDTDRFSFYLSYHAMFCVAGELLAELPVVEDEWDEDLWFEWLKMHTLTRQNGRWLADRRDLIPPISNQNKKYSEHWCWEISREDFDTKLGIVDGCLPQKLIVDAHWYMPNGYSQTETVSIASALVSPLTAEALVRTLQTAIHPYHYAIPETGDIDSEIRTPDFKFTGWLKKSRIELRLDQFDPYSGQIDYPGTLPGRTITRLFKLVADKERRIWRSEDGAEVMWSQLWGDRYTNNRYESSDDCGHLFKIDVQFLKQLLTKVQRNLIVEVQIDRDDKNSRESREYMSPYFRLYLFRADGSFYVMSDDSAGDRELAEKLEKCLVRDWLVQWKAFYATHINCDSND